MTSQFYFFIRLLISRIGELHLSELSVAGLLTMESTSYYCVEFKKQF